MHLWVLFKTRADQSLNTAVMSTGELETSISAMALRKELNGRNVQGKCVMIRQSYVMRIMTPGAVTAGRRWCYVFVLDTSNHGKGTPSSDPGELSGDFQEGLEGLVVWGVSWFLL